MTVTSEDTRISPEYTVKDWRCVDFSSPGGWDEAVDIFLDRIEGRFLKPVQAMLQDPESMEWCGFAVLAIDCLLVETLQAFEAGRPSSKRASKKMFCEFLTTSPYFKGDFDKGKAQRFYHLIRCGILHQAEIYRDSLIKRGRSHPMVSDSATGEGLVINRCRFHEALKEHVDWYAQQLRADGDSERKKNFRAKMDAICTECTAPSPRICDDRM